MRARRRRSRWSRRERGRPPEIGVGSGLSTLELGLHVCYNIYLKRGPAVLSPYLGVDFERSFGDTARYAREEGQDVKGWRFLLGLRTWF